MITLSSPDFYCQLHSIFREFRKKLYLMERFVYGVFTYCNFSHIKLRHRCLSTDITIFSKQQTPKPSQKVAIPEEKLSNGSK